MDELLAHDDIVLAFEGVGVPVLDRRWLHSASVDEPVAFEEYSTGPSPTSGTAYEIYADRQGSISHVPDTSTGSIVAEYSYDGYGRQTQFAGTLFQHYGYTGRETDPESGLMHFRARVFDPLRGRFLQVDPLEFSAETLNLTEYVHNNPYNFTDPSGLISAKNFLDLAAEGASRALGVTGQASVGMFNLAAEIATNLDFHGSLLRDYEKYQKALAGKASSNANASGYRGKQYLYVGKCGAKNGIAKVGISKNYAERLKRHEYDWKRRAVRPLKMSHFMTLRRQKAARAMALALESAITKIIVAQAGKRLDVCYHKRPSGKL